MFPCENKKKITLFLDSNQDVVDALLMYGNRTMVYPNFLEEIFHYFHDKFIPNLLKLTNSLSITKHKYLASLLEDEERAESKNTPDTSKNSL